MADAIALCKQALAIVGTRSTIAALDEGSTEANACALFFDTARDELLAAHWWGFARRSETLALLKALPGTPERPTWDTTGWNSTMPAIPWLYEYAYPTDALGARYIEPVFTTGYTGTPIFGTQGFDAPTLVNGSAVEFVIGLGQNEDGNNIKTILTNQGAAALVYTARVPETEIWDQDFSSAFVYVLAGYLCFGLSGDVGLTKQIIDLGAQKVMQARLRDGNQGLTVQDRIPDSLRVRGFSDAGSVVLGPLGANS